MLFPHMLGIIIPTDELILFRGVGIPPTSIQLNIRILDTDLHVVSVIDQRDWPNKIKEGCNCLHVCVVREDRQIIYH